MLSPLAAVHAIGNSRSLAQSARPHARAATSGPELMRDLRVALEANLERVPAGSPERERLANDLVARVLGPERRVA